MRRGPAIVSHFRIGEEGAAHDGPSGASPRVRERGNYLAHVDGLRAVAIALVVVYHAWPHELTGGFVGVDVFFVVSGFLITRLMLAEMQAGTFSIFAFFARRIRRLLPAATLMIVAVLAAGWMILLPETFRDLGRSVVAAVLMFANLHFYATSDYFAAPADEKALLHTWSLSVEDQFYLTWPLLLMLLAPRLPRAWLVAVTAGLLAASLAHAEARLASDADYAFYMLAPRAWELLAGCLTALLAPYLTVRRSASALLAGTGLTLIVASAVLLSASVPFPGVSAVPAVAGTVMVIVAGLGDDHSWPVRGLAWRPMVLLGLISYSLYLWHWPVLSLGQYAASRALTPAEAAAAVALSLLLAVLSWRYVERPFRVHGPLPGRAAWKTIAAGASVMTVLALAGGAVRALDGLPSRFDGAVGTMFDQLAHGNPLRPACDGHKLAFANDQRCNFGRRKQPGESYEIAVLGDSNADHLVPLVTRWAEANGLAGHQVTQSACAPLLGALRPREITDRSCAPYHRTLLRFAEANPGLRLVVLAGVWRGYEGGLAWNGLEAEGLTKPAGANGVIGLEPMLAATVRYFRSRGIRVHIFGQVPHFKVLPARCTAAALQAGRDVGPCGRPAAEARREVAASERVLRALAAADPGVTVTIPTDVMCDTAWCSPMRDGVFLYRDGGHLNAAGSRHLARYFELPAIASGSAVAPQP